MEDGNGAERASTNERKTTERKRKKTTEREVFQLNMYESSDNEFSVFMEIGEEYSEFEAWIALECAAAKMGVENGFITENENGETIYHLESEEDND